MTAPYAECDLDALASDETIARYFVDQMHGTVPQRFILPLNLPADSCDPHVGAGFTAPVSLPAPGAPNETRNP